MTVETKFDAGDTVFRLMSNHVVAGKVNSIHIDYFGRENPIKVNYDVFITDDSDKGIRNLTGIVVTCDEKILFKSKKELLESL